MKSWQRCDTADGEAGHRGKAQDIAAILPEKRIVQASEVERTIQAGEPAEFDNCIIESALILSGLTIEQPVHFIDTVFKKSVDFSSTTFNI